MTWVIILLIAITAFLASIVGLLIGASQIGLRQDIASLRTDISGLKSIAPSVARRTKAERISGELAQVEVEIKALSNQIALVQEREDQERERRTNEELDAIRQQLEKAAEKLSEIHDAVRSIFD